VNGENIPAKRHRLPHVEIYEVTGDELESIEREASNIGTDLQFCLVLLSVALSFTASLVLTTITNDRVYAVIFIITAIAYILGLYFGKRWFRQRDAFKKCVQKIRDRSVGPIGQEGKVLQPTELAELPSIEPPAQPAQGDHNP
jgi:hypothetical protein